MMFNTWFGRDRWVIVSMSHKISRNPCIIAYGRDMKHLSYIYIYYIKLELSQGDYMSPQHRFDT